LQRRHRGALPPAEPAVRAEPAPVAAAPAPARPERTIGAYLLYLAAIVLIVAGLKAAAPLLVPFLLALFIAVICAPMFLGMQRRGMPSGLALLIMVGLLLALGVSLAWLLNRAIANHADLLAQYQPALRARTAELFAWLEARGIATPESVREYFNLQWVLRNLGTIVGTVGDVVATAFIVLVITIFMLLEAAALPVKFRFLAGVGDGAWARLHQIGTDVRRYMVLKTIMSLLTGGLVMLLLYAMGIKFAVTLGLVAFLLNFVPVIGSIIAGIPGVLLALVEFGFGSALITLIGYVVINVGVSNGVEPRFLGHDLDLSPLVVLASVIFWGWILGPVGMLLSVPLTMTLKIALEHDEGTRWLGLLLGGKPHPQHGPS
jgi:predicted PurR-regulated permease PerM